MSQPHFLSFSGFTPDVGKFFIFALGLFLVSLSASAIAFFFSAVVRIFAVANLLIAMAFVVMMVGQIYPSEIQLNKANTSDTEAAFLDLHLSISNDIFQPIFMINVTTLILKLSISHF